MAINSELRISGMDYSWSDCWFFDVEKGDNGSGKPDVSPYDEAMAALSSLIIKRSRARKSNKGDRFELFSEYLKVL